MKLIVILNPEAPENVIVNNSKSPFIPPKRRGNFFLRTPMTLIGQVKADFLNCGSGLNTYFHESFDTDFTQDC